ncbi:MAG: type II secretion system F family protein [Candidatus Aenigmarchaeota archaeon]|nr:type II secretion system F family protein [Candidatus Aenigmarchaeota archaeon]MBU5689103.1 type II secretion system F family protein [Candidatus Aenigmarchaeota archaeon]
MIGIYRYLYKLMPKFYREWVKSYLKYANFSIPEEKFVGFTILYGLMLLISFYILFWLLNVSYIFALAIFVVFEVFMHVTLILVADSRANFADEILPDVLSLFSSNIRSGLTPDKALMLTARPEFGPLEEEIKRAAKKTLSGESIEDAIKVIPERINSKTLERTVKLLSEGMAKGGSLQNLLDGLANDIRESRLIKKEISAQVMVYAIFIFFAVGIGAPVLLATSNHLIETMSIISSNINLDKVSMPAQIPIKIQNIEIDNSFLLRYSLSSLAITSIFGGLLIGLIKDGTERAGIKYIPILLVLSIGIFFLSKLMIFKFFALSPI